MLKFLIAVATSFALAASAQAPASTQTQAQLPDASRFADPETARGATLSPDGNYVAYIRRIGGAQQVVVLSLVTQAEQVAQQINDATGRIDWIVWKGNDRIVLGALFNGAQHGVARTGSRI